jgi:hypothetical protein
MIAKVAKIQMRLAQKFFLSTTRQKFSTEIRKIILCSAGMAKPRPGWKPSKPFQPGQVANPRGRPRGRQPCERNVWDAIRNRGDRDPLDILSEFANSQLVEPNLRIQAASVLSGYRHGKRPPMRYVESVTGLKAPASLEEARQYLARLTYLVAAGRIDIDGAAAIREQLQAFIDATIGTGVEDRLRALEEMARAQATRGFGTAIVVESSMPVMPGCENVLMPNRAPPVIDQKPNPWGEAPDAGTAVDATPKPQGEPEGRS